MEPLYDKTGRVVGWMDSDDILDLNGWYRAFIYDECVYSYRNGSHVGWLEDGWLRDSHMQPVAFLRGAVGGPAKPGMGGVPGRPGKPGRPGRPGRAGKPGRPGKSNTWSTAGWDGFAPAAR